MSRSVAAAAAGAVALGGAFAAATVPAAAPTKTPACANTVEIPTAATLAKATTALVCLINAERTKRGIPALRVSFQLRQAAAAHSKDMVARKYFSHTSRDGATPRRRVQRTGYFRKGKRGQLNETLVLGAGSDASPERLAKKLFGHPPHKKIALSRLYRDIGAGLVLGYPLPTTSDPNTTLTVNYGSR